MLKSDQVLGLTSEWIQEIEDPMVDLKGSGELRRSDGTMLRMLRYQRI